MDVAFPHLNPLPRGADCWRYGDFRSLPPRVGEGWDGGKKCWSHPHPNPPPSSGRGHLPPLWSLADPQDCRATSQELPVRRCSSERTALSEKSASGVASISWSARISTCIQAVVHASHGMSVACCGHCWFEEHPRGNQRIFQVATRSRNGSRGCMRPPAATICWQPSGDAQTERSAASAGDVGETGGAEAMVRAT